MCEAHSKDTTTIDKTPELSKTPESSDASPCEDLQAQQHHGHKDCHEQSGTNELPPMPNRPDVLWAVHVDNDDDFKSFYRASPFGGIDFKLSESTLPTSKSEGGIIHISVDVRSKDLDDRKGNSVHDWWHNRADFDFGGSIRAEVIDGHEIIINSQKLLKALESIIDYDSEQFSRGLDRHWIRNSRLGCFESLLLYCYELKAACERYLNTFSQPTECLAIRTILNEQNIIEMQELAPAFAKPETSLEGWDSETVAEAALLLRLLAPHYQEKVLPFWRKLQSPEPRVEFEYLWALYKPGSLVYKRINDSFIALVVVSAIRRESIPDSQTPADKVLRYEVEAWYLEYDGRFMRRQTTLTRIETFDGDRPLTSLPIVPAVRYDAIDGGLRKSQILARGDKFLQVVKDGFAYRLFSHPRSSYKGQIILDPAVYNDKRAQLQNLQSSGSYWHEYYNVFEVDRNAEFDKTTVLNDVEPSDGRGNRRFRSYHDVDTSDLKQLETLSSGAAILFSAYIGGLALATKKWMMFEVEGIMDDHPWQPQRQLDACLVIDNDDKELLRTVQPKGAKASFGRADFVRGKGEGQVFLLHGPAGTGKTLTAECVANDTHRPLISLAYTDIQGLGGVEQMLRMWFNLASKWDAILLIDEADVFLEKRQVGDSGRNFHVTVFLRTMEYYSGVLFLTTNRVLKIDDSFISRITASIRYPELSAETRHQIWLKFYEMYEKPAAPRIKIMPDAKARVRKDPCDVNGREIRNIMQNAIRYASLEAAENSSNQPIGGVSSGISSDNGVPPKILWIEWDHISKALERHNAFKEYVKKANRHMDEHQRNAFSGNY